MDALDHVGPAHAPGVDHLVDAVHHHVGGRELDVAQLSPKRMYVKMSSRNTVSGFRAAPSGPPDHSR